MGIAFRSNLEMIVEKIKKEQFINFTHKLELVEGCPIAIIGKNGYGKTTFLGLSSGNLIPDSGIMNINDKQYCFPINSFNRPKYQKQLRKKILYIENQNYLYPNFTVLQNVNYIMSIDDFDKDVFINVLNKLNFDKKYFGMRVKELSFGTKQKISLALMFSTFKSIVMLDEPTQGIDIETRKAFLDLLMSYKKLKCFLLSTNDQTILNAFDLFLLCENDEVKVLYDNPYGKSRD